jgi:hypothetical protein
MTTLTDHYSPLDRMLRRESPEQQAAHTLREIKDILFQCYHRLGELDNALGQPNEIGDALTALDITGEGLGKLANRVESGE